MLEVRAKCYWKVGNIVNPSLKANNYKKMKDTLHDKIHTHLWEDYQSYSSFQIVVLPKNSLKKPPKMTEKHH